MKGLRLENTIDENKFLSRKVVERYKSAYSGHYHKRFIENEWAAAGGVVYPTWTEDAAELEAGGEVVVGMDWGVAGVTAALFFTKREYGWQIVGEYYHDGRRTGRLRDEHHAAAMLKQPFKVKEIVIDPSAIPLHDALRAKGFRVVTANNDIQRGIITVDHAFRQGTLRVRKGGCPSLLAELDAYIWSAVDDKPVKKDDHACDAMRYASMRLLPLRLATPGTLQGY